LTSILLSGPTHGSLLDNGDGTLTYTPETDFQGVDTFYYAAYDGISDSTPTAVTITVGTQM
ncbi:MAG: large repetitive protein, partial [Mycobacterium sp.]|nr:large repetitive protein [Mycobacterium sp.]